MTSCEERVVLNLVDFAAGNMQGRWFLSRHYCNALIGLYQAPPGYVHWESDVALAVQLTRLLTDPVASAQRNGLLNAIRRGASGKARIWCNRQMAAHLLCLFDCDARREADSVN